MTPDTSVMEFQIEGINDSNAFATDTIDVTATPNGGGTSLQDAAKYTVIEVNAGVDGNRDTNIDFASSHDRQLLFWLNNDKEGTYAGDNTIDAEIVEFTQGIADDADNFITSRRDLEDLAPFRFSVDPLLFNNSSDIRGNNPTAGQLNARYVITARNTDGEAFRLFKSSNTNADVYRHVSNESSAIAQVNDPEFNFASGLSFSSRSIMRDVSAGLNARLLEAISDDIFIDYGEEFSNISELDFVTEVIYPDGTLVRKSNPIELDIRDIRSFYTRWDIPFIAGGNDLRQDVSFQHFTTPTTETHTSQVQNEPFFSGNDTTVLVHGWNMIGEVGNDWKAAYAETMFKRLYWQGHRGEFVAFNWPTFADSEGPRDWPFVGVGANITFNASEFQAFRSAQALKDVLETYRGPTSNLQPVHLLAHSLGNVVAGEALRQWSADFSNNDPLVTNYVAMESAISAGAYGNNDRDTEAIGFQGRRPIPDLYRFWSHGRDGFSDASLGISPYFSGAGFADENRINFYNQQDFALDLWDTNNDFKESLLQSPVWLHDYEYTRGAGGNTNTDTFLRTENGPDTTLTLTDASGRPGRDAYEIIAFFARAASLPVGTKLLTQFDVNVDLEQFTLKGGSDNRANHSYQFNHDASETWGFYDRLKTEVGFSATYGVGLIVDPVMSNSNEDSPFISLDLFEGTSRFAVPAGEKYSRTYSGHNRVESSNLRANLQFDEIDSLFEQQGEYGFESFSDVAKRKALPESSDDLMMEIVFEQLGSAID